MNRNTKILTAILVLSNLGWIGAYINQSVDHGLTITYQDASYETVSKMLEQALVVANENLVGEPLSEVEALIKTDSYGSEPFIKEGCLYAGGLCLEISEDSKISKVRAE